MNTDFSDLLKILNAYTVKYMIVGGYAVMYYSEPRFTKAIDIWIEPTPENTEQVWQALAEFGAPLEQVTSADFQNKELIYQIGIAPNRIDIIMDVPGVDFKNAWEKKNISHYNEVPVYILSLPDLIQAKKTAGREQDLIDLKHFERIKK